MGCKVVKNEDSQMTIHMPRISEFCSGLNVGDPYVDNDGLYQFPDLLFNVYEPNYNDPAFEGSNFEKWINFGMLFDVVHPSTSLNLKIRLLTEKDYLILCAFNRILFIDKIIIDCNNHDNGTEAYTDLMYKS